MRESMAKAFHETLGESWCRWAKAAIEGPWWRRMPPRGEETPSRAVKNSGRHAITVEGMPWRGDHGGLRHAMVKACLEGLGGRVEGMYRE